MNTRFISMNQRPQDWYIIDAKDMILGKVAVKAAHLLRGKHLPSYAPHQNMGTKVIIINAQHFLVTGKKMDDKRYYRHSGYPGGLKQRTLRETLKKKPLDPVEKAIKGMLPKNRLGRELARNMYVFAGETHRFDAQKPVNVKV